MARRPRKTSASRTPASVEDAPPRRRGRPPGKKSAATKTPARKTAVPVKRAGRKAAARKVATVSKAYTRAPRRKSAAGPRAAGDADLIERVGRLIDELGAVGTLLGEVQGVRADLLALTRKVDTLLAENASVSAKPTGSGGTTEAGGMAAEPVQAPSSDPDEGRNPANPGTGLPQ